jgi:hypothetical protein
VFLFFINPAFSPAISMGANGVFTFAGNEATSNNGQLPWGSPFIVAAAS